MTLYEDLKWRGLIQDISSPELVEKLNRGGMTFILVPTPRLTACTLVTTLLS